MWSLRISSSSRATRWRSIATLILGRVALDCQTIHAPDVLADPEFKRPDWQEVGRQRTVLGVPLMREGMLLGVIILARTEVRPFTEKQIDLVTTFADQAVIAINNVGLFEEVQARTAELQQSLEYQTATSDVLSVISRSPSQIQPVLETIVATAAQLCDAERAFTIATTEWSCVIRPRTTRRLNCKDFVTREPDLAGPASALGEPRLRS